MSPVGEVFCGCEVVEGFMRQIREIFILRAQLIGVVFCNCEQTSLRFRFCGNVTPPKPILLRFPHAVHGRLRALRPPAHLDTEFDRVIIHDSVLISMAAMVIAANLDHARASGKS